MAEPATEPAPAVAEMVAGLPRPHLRPFVARYHGYRIEGASPGVHHGLPSRHLTVIVTLDGTVDLAAQPDPAQPPASYTTLAGGLHARPALISHDGHQHGLQLALTPRGARALLGLPAGELGVTVVHLDTLLGASVAAEFVERLRGEPTWAGRFAQLDALFTRLARPTEPAPELDWTWRRLSASHGQATVSDLARQVGWSRRHLSERFRREFGLTPKVAGRVMRFERARHLLERAPRPALADVAHRSGYYDQAHLHREWRELAGCTPSWWLTEDFPSVHDTTADPSASSVT